MKSILFATALITALPIHFPGSVKSEKTSLNVTGEIKLTQPNLIIVTLDGFRWQELFHGADSALIGNTRYTLDPDMSKLLYWAPTSKERRERLMPFCWNVIANKGQLYGHRTLGNKVNTANIYSFSYPGYNVLFTGNTDLFVSSNKKRNNRNYNLLEFLHTRKRIKEKLLPLHPGMYFPIY